MNKKIILVISLIFAVFALTGCVKQQVNLNVNSDNKTSMTEEQNNANQQAAAPGEAENRNDLESNEAVAIPTEVKNPVVVVTTNQGVFKIELFQADAPKTVENFIKLSREKFYDGTKFHRVIKNFMIQGGDPLSKDDDWSDDGTGGPGYDVSAEIKLKNTRGTVATARLGDQVNPEKNSSGSQFFINTKDNAFLDGEYTVFGQVVSGMETVDKIENVQTNDNDHPLEDMVIEKIVIE